MKSLVLLMCLAHLWGCHSAPPAVGLGYRQPNCDDPEVEQVAQIAVDYINTHLTRGYKHVLNQIDKVKVWPRRPTGDVYDIELDTLETNCHALDPTPLVNCSVRQPTEHAVEGDCDFRILKQDGQFFTLYSKCDSSPDSAEDVRKRCPNCPLLTSFNNSKVVHAVDVALNAFNAQSNGSYYKLVEVSRAQLVPLPPSVYVEFAVAATDCPHDVIDPSTCNLAAEKQYGFCKGTLTEKVGGEDVAATCTVFQTQPVLPQPQPDGAAVDPALPPPPSPNQPDSLPPPLSPNQPAALMAAAGPPVAPVHPVHYDLRHAFSGVASVESASGEAFRPVEPPVVLGSGPVVVGPGPVVRPCPGRIRYFKI
ncbi:alpha-2-HS-glycoprotein [Rhynchocyon petersi]